MTELIASIAGSFALLMGIAAGGLCLAVAGAIVYSVWKGRKDAQ